MDLALCPCLIISESLSTTSTSYSYSSNGLQRDFFKETSSCWPAVSKTACQQSKTNFCSKNKQGSTLQNPQLEETFQFQWYFQGPLIMVRGITLFLHKLWYKFHEKNSPNRHLHRSSCKGLLAGSWAPQINGSTWWLWNEAIQYIGVSKNSGTPKWMVYNGKPY